MEEHTERFRKKRIMERRKRNKQRGVRIAAVLIVIFFAWVAYTPAKNLFIKKIITFNTAEWGTLEEQISGEAVVVREEKVILSPAAGKFMPAVNEWEKVPVGQVLGYMATQKSNTSGDQVKIAVRSSGPGLVSYHPDGLEGLLKKNFLSEIDTEKLAALLSKKPDTLETGTWVESGRPVCKIVDNLVNPLLYLRLPSDTFKSPPKIGDKVVIKISNGLKRTTGIKDMKSAGGEIHLVLELFNAYDPELKSRFVPVQIILASYEGVIVPQKALVSKDKKTGVFISREGTAKWVEVEVQGIIGDEAAVRGLRTGGQYIANPSLVKEGIRVE